MVDKSKHDEFRTANVALRKELEDQKKRFEGIDPDEVRKLAEEEQKLEETRQLKLGEVEKVLENRLKSSSNARRSGFCSAATMAWCSSVVMARFSLNRIAGQRFLGITGHGSQPMSRAKL